MPNNVKQRLIEGYEKLKPKQKQQLMLFGGIGLILLVSTIIITTTSKDVPVLTKKYRKVEYNLFGDKTPREISLDGVAARVKKLTDDLSEVRVTYQKQDKKFSELMDFVKENNKSIKDQGDKLKARYDDLENKLRSAQEMMDNQVPLPAIPNGNVGRQKNNKSPQPLSQPVSGDNAPSTDFAPGLKIRVITGHGEESPKKTSGTTAQTTTLASSTELTKKREEQKRIQETVNIKKPNKLTRQPDIYLPSGTIVSGTMMTGLDAPTSNQSRMDPFPALLRIKHEAILPNNFRMDVAECFVIASGYGDLSSERAYLRAERLSCIKKDGTVIETPMDAYSVGEDGKAGIRGRIVSKNGQVIGNALLAGFISGLGKAFTPQRVQPLSLNPGSTTSYQYPSPELVGGQALGGGVDSAANQIAAYYLQMAQNIFPIVEVDAGRRIDFILVRGMVLTGKARSTAILPDRYTGQATYGPATRRRGIYNNSSSGLSGFSLPGITNSTSNYGR